MTPIRLPPQPRILVVALRRLGDVLLTTPLIRSVKRAFPGSSVDALVFAGTEGILTGNPDLTRVIAIPQRPSLKENLALLRRLGRRYDLAISTQTGDRPTAFAWAAGRQSAGLVDADGFAAKVKRYALSRAHTIGQPSHRVLEVLRIAELLDIPALTEIVPPAGGDGGTDLLPQHPYVVVHAAPLYTYKRWTADGWRVLAAALRERGLATVVTGSKGDGAYLDKVWNDCETVRLDGKLGWPELSTLIGRARAYVGPDTAVSHLAAAVGAPTVALYGPTDPRLWGPWPVGGLDRPWAAAGTIQRRGNVWLVQNPLPCLPCQQEGCERRLESHSECLDALSAAQVITALDQALASRRAA